MYLKIFNVLIILLIAPLFPGIINKVKAFFGGRKGQPVLQLYYDIFKLCRKGSVYSRSTSYIFIWAPVIYMASLIVSIMLLPFPGGDGALISFPGDMILFVYLIALGRFVMVLAALDTASSFEGMGASREIIFSAIAEPAFFIALAVLVCKTNGFSLSDSFNGFTLTSWFNNLTVNILLFLALFIILLSENSRVPFDDPNTHLELTMIHEVIVLDYSGPDLGIILYGSSIKLVIFSSVIALFITPNFSEHYVIEMIAYFIEIGFIVCLIGVLESIIARFEFVKVPQMLLIATILSIVSLTLMLRF